MKRPHPSLVSITNRYTGNPSADVAALRSSQDSPIALCIATIEIALAKPIPEFDKAHSALAKLERELSEPKPTPDLTTPLTLVAGISIRTANTLENIGVRTVGDLLNRREAELLAIPNFGARTLREVREAVRELGYR